MKILLVSGHSSLATILRPVLADFAEVVTAGRNGCDTALDLSWPTDHFQLPPNLDAVINLAAHFGGTASGDLIAAEEINVLGALKLAHACLRAKTPRFVQVSSIFAGLEKDSPFFNSYALSKRHAEEMLELHCRQTGLDLSILRPTRIYGAGENSRRHQPFLYDLLNRAKHGKEIVLYGRHDAWRNFIHAKDVAEIIARIIRRGISGQYACVHPDNVRLSEIAKAAFAACGSIGSIRFDTDKPDVPDNAFETDETLYRLIDYRPRISIQDGLTLEATGWEKGA